MLPYGTQSASIMVYGTFPGQFAWVLGLFVLLSGCVGIPNKSADFNALLVAPYTLDSGDVLRVNVFEQPSLSGSFAVDVAGYVNLPLIGAVPARGLTPDQVDATVTQTLQENYLRHPDVSVEIETYRPFFVLGEIANAGQFPYVGGMTVRSAIAIAGGFSARAVTSHVDVTRTINGEVHAGQLRLTDPVRPGDVITVRERWF